MTNISIELDEELLEDSVEYEAWLINTESSITFRGNNLATWTEELCIPTISLDSELSINELELLNQRIINITDVVMNNLSLAKIAFSAAKTNYELDLMNNKRILCDTFILEGKRIPGNETLTSLAAEKCQKSFRIMARSELVFEYWNTQSYKLIRLDSRMTSLGVAKRS